MPVFTSILSGPATRSLRLRLPLGQWIRVAHERRMLGNLPEHLLRDIGVDAATAAEEAARPFWDLPSGR